MAKLGSYSYPDIRFGDAVELATRILTKFKGVVSVKGLAWELGMAEGSGTLFAKVAALRDFGLIEGRGELRVSPLAQKILHPTSPEEGLLARAEAFQRVELLRLLFQRFEGELPDDLGLLVGLEEITKASREEIVRRCTLIQKHLSDSIRILRRPVLVDNSSEYSGKMRNVVNPSQLGVASEVVSEDYSGKLLVIADKRQFSAPITPEDIDIAISLLTTIKGELNNSEVLMEAGTAESDEEEYWEVPNWDPPKESV